MKRRTILQRGIAFGLLFLIPLIILACQNAGQAAPASGPTLTIFAAASLTEPFNELKEIFLRSHPNVEVIFNFAASSDLANQLIHGAPGNLFVSAAEKPMRLAVESGRVNASDIQPLASTDLVIITPVENPGNVQQLQDLIRPGLKLTLAASETPIGAYTIELFQKAGAAFDQPDFPFRILPNVISYEKSARAVLNKVLLGESDAGIVYRTDTRGSSQGKINLIEIPQEINVVCPFLIAPVSDSPNAELAQAFLNLATGEEGRKILSKYGFKIP